MVLLSEYTIREYAVWHMMIQPYCSDKVNGVAQHKLMSYGQNAGGYDIRLSHKQFLIPDLDSVPPDYLLDPKNVPPNFFVPTEIQQDVNGWYFIIPPNSYGLGVSMEKFRMPRDVLAVCVGKSSYARAGVIINVTPLEPDWEGYLTIEVTNTNAFPIRIYAGEGIAQLLFHRLDRVPHHSYHGKYQFQEDKPQPSR